MMFILGVILLIVGALIVIKSETMLEAFGRVDFFERNLSTSGGSRLGYKLLGIIVAILGMMAISGLLGGFMEWITTPLTKYNNSGR
ncbi:MAG: hypothetical protein PF572_05830 [Patescibacteria group bacterium]|jgi:hypothetical protein|nr:hypothetical protein [Patescibacteria group bacterium]